MLGKIKDKSLDLSPESTTKTGAKELLARPALKASEPIKTRHAAQRLSSVWINGGHCGWLCRHTEQQTVEARKMKAWKLSFSCSRSVPALSRLNFVRSAISHGFITEWTWGHSLSPGEGKRSYFNMSVDGQKGLSWNWPSRKSRSGKCDPGLEWDLEVTQPLEVTPEYKAERKRASEGRRMEKKGGEQTCQESPLEGNRYGRKRGPENCAMPWHKHIPPAGRPCHQPRPPVDIPLTAMHPVVERHLYVSVTDSNMPKFYFPAHGKYL